MNNERYSIFFKAMMTGLFVQEIRGRRDLTTVR
jgi:hypothetical protein